LLQIWLYASKDEGTFSKRYDELCEILNLHRYRQPSRIKEQFGPSLDELTSQGYLAEWRVEPTSDRKAYKIVMMHGEKFHNDRRTRLGEPVAAKPTPEPVAKPEPDSQPEPALTEEGTVDPALLEALLKRGVREREARQILAKLSSPERIQDQLEWADHVIAQGGEGIMNPAGLVVSLIRDGVMPPESFETTSKRRAKEEAKKAKLAAETEEAHLRKAYEEYLEDEIDDEIGRIELPPFEALVTSKMEALLTEHATFAVWGPEKGRNIARAEVKKDIKKEIGYRLFDFETFCRLQKMIG
jgi:hypothetical protein